MMDEIILVRRAKTGDGECFAQLVRNHTTRVYRIAFALLQDGSDAEDAVQEAFITAYRSIKKLEKDEAFGSWLARIVTTRAYDIIRKRQHGKKVSPDQNPLPDVEELPSPVDSIKATELSLDLHQAIERLPEAHRLVVLLRYAEDATTDEIAYILGRPAGTVRRMLSESYRLMRHYLEEEIA